MSDRRDGAEEEDGDDVLVAPWSAHDTTSFRHLYGVLARRYPDPVRRSTGAEETTSSKGPTIIQLAPGGDVDAYLRAILAIGEERDRQG
jgi:hypothetical protein